MELSGFAVYWRPKASLQSEADLRGKPEVIDRMFDSNIGTRENPAHKLKYLLGPINSSARMVYCPNPDFFDYERPQVDLEIKMSELSLSLTKYQYQVMINYYD